MNGVLLLRSFIAPALCARWRDEFWRLLAARSSGSEAPTAREIEQHLGALSREVCPHALRRAIALPFLTARRRQVRGAYAAGRYDDALSHARVLRSEARAAYGAKHPVVASAIANEGLMHKALGDHDLAIDA